MEFIQLSDKRFRPGDKFVFCFTDGVSEPMTYDMNMRESVGFINPNSEWVRNDKPDITTVLPVYPVQRDGKELYRL